VPGDPGWVAGDRLTLVDTNWLIYTGYVGDHSRSRGAEPLEVQTTYQLMDVNRQLIGRKVVDHVSPEDTSIQRFTEFYTYLADLSFDGTTWVDGGFPVTMPGKTYSGDGLMNMIADQILYTGKTTYLALTQVENTFELHYHALGVGRLAGLQINDDPLVTGALAVTYMGAGVTFGGVPVVYTYSSSATVVRPWNPQAGFTATDLKNNITARNGVVDVVGSNAGSIARHGAGGLKHEAVLDYSGLNEDSLVLVANNILNNAGDEVGAYSCTLGPLTSAEVVLIPAGSLIWADCAVFGAAQMLRIAHVTLTVTRDSGGEPVPGLWNAALELGYPLRLPSAVPGFGGQGGDAGRLSDPPTWTDTLIAYDDPGIPAGSSTTVTAQLVDQDKNAVPVEGVTLTWTLVQWEDEAMTVAGSDFSLSPATSQTDISGLALTVVSHDTAGATIMWWVTAGP